MSIVRNELLTVADSNKLDSLPKSYLAVKSTASYSPVSQDEAAATIFTDIEKDEIDPVGWAIEPSMGAVRNVSGRNLVGNFGVVSMQLVSTNNAIKTLFTFSEISTDNGATWVINQGSGREEALKSNAITYPSKASQGFNIPNDALARFRVFTSGAGISIDPIAFTGGGVAITGPSFRWWFMEA